MAIAEIPHERLRMRDETHLPRDVERRINRRLGHVRRMLREERRGWGSLEKETAAGARRVLGRCGCGAKAYRKPGPKRGGLQVDGSCCRACLDRATVFDRRRGVGSIPRNLLERYGAEVA